MSMLKSKCKIKGSAVLVSVLVLIFACAPTKPTLKSPGSKSIELATYYVQAPPGDGWKTKRYKKRDIIKFSNKSGPKAEIMVYRMIPPLNLLDQSAQEIADDYRRYEEDIMVKRGVNLGQYELEYVRKENVVIGEKKFYYMEFRQLMNKNLLGFRSIVDGVLYLYFPPSFDQKPIFYGFIFKDFYVHGMDRIKLTDLQIKAVLKSFRLKVR